MLKAPTDFIVVFILVSVFLILVMAVFISMIIYRYQQKQNAYFKDIETQRALHENTLLQSQVEIQNRNFKSISHEIDNNIGQKLTLAKLYLNGTDFTHSNNAKVVVDDLITIIGEITTDLNNLKHSISSDFILSNGLVKALEFETEQLARSGIYKTNFSTTGDPISMTPGIELIAFRMIQEVLNNVAKHADASTIHIDLHYNNNVLTIEVQDNGKGFNPDQVRHGTGLQNIKKRAEILRGTVAINSRINFGTEIRIKIPLYESKKA